MNKSFIAEDRLPYIYELVKNVIAPGNRAFMPRQIQEAIDKVLDKRFPPNWKNDIEFRRQMKENFLSCNFKTYNNHYFSEFYTAYYIPNNLYKIQLMFLELIKLSKIDLSKSKIKILDIGTATGTTAWALVDFYEILYNVLKLYEINTPGLPVLEIDGLERSKSNIELFNELFKEINPDSKKIKVNIPIETDVIKDGLKKIKLRSYDIIIASNVLSEFERQIDREHFVEVILDNIHKDTLLILIDTAILRDTLALKRIQFKFADKKGITIINPCGKINGFSRKCKHCYSFRRESLIIPETMKLLQLKIDESDENEKLKWSYVIFHKSKVIQNHISNNNFLLSEIDNLVNDVVKEIRLEIVSGKMFNNKNKEDENYYLKICDQSEDTERVLLKVPKYFELPKYNFGDILEINDAKIETIEWQKPPTVKYAITINPELTTVKNLSDAKPQKGLVRFENIEEENLQYFLYRFFGYSKFYEGQFEILQKVLRNENVLGILATGGGKSLTFQLPALLKPGVSIVVAPLKSLMDNQVYNLKVRYGLDFVDRIHSGMSLIEKQHVLNRFKNGHIKILYIAPERLQQKSFQKELTSLIERGVNINYFPIDEAHCISEWGHDFRPSYARLKNRRNELVHSTNEIPSLVALTATASDKVRKDVINLLNMTDNDLLHRIVDRKELSLEVIKLNYNFKNHSYSITYRGFDAESERYSLITKEFSTGKTRHDILLFILQDVLPNRFDNFNINENSGLIFTIYGDPDKDGPREREGAKWLSKSLRIKGVENKPWFAAPGYKEGLTSKQKETLESRWEKIKTKTQDAYIKDEIKLLCTTKGFGMGIDKPNIRYIIHFGFPGSMEAYFQQIGRAGRDRKHSHCILMYDPPTSDCKKDLENEPIPKCYVLDNSTKKYKFQSCNYHRSLMCDYAKQIYFIETAYPTEEELQDALNYFINKANSNQTYPYVYSIKDYMIEKIKGADTARELSSNYEKKIIETLYTLKFISEFTETYFKVNLKKKKNWQEIKNSTNNEIIRQHIDYIMNLDTNLYPNVIKPNTVAGFDELFNIKEYICALRSQKAEDVLIDEVVQFFKLLEERNDIVLKFNWHMDFGYEIKLNPEIINTIVSSVQGFELVTEWKKTQYIMLKNITDYAELLPFDLAGSQHNQMCRRAHILSIFATESASVTPDVRCNFCDNCGFNNSWETQADTIVATEDEKSFIKELKDVFSNTSSESDYLLKRLEDLLTLSEEMITSNYFALAKNISNAWLEQIGETENSATNFIIALVELNNSNLSSFYSRINIVFSKFKTEWKFIQETIKFLHINFKLDLKELYFECFYSENTDELKRVLEIYNSNDYQPFEEIESTLSLKILDKKVNDLNKNLRILEEIEFYG